MKHILLTIILVFMLSGCSNDTAIIPNEDVADIQGQGIETADTQGQENTDIQYKKKIIVGTWQDASYISAVYQKR